ncbi:MAG: hypothetical protein AAB525_03460 [Patescibacteria group bacterium]
MSLIVAKKGDEENIAKWGVMDYTHNHKVGTILTLDGIGFERGEYQVLQVSKVENIKIIQPQFYPKYFINEFDGSMEKITVEFMSKKTTFLVAKGVSPFWWDFGIKS